LLRCARLQRYKPVQHVQDAIEIFASCTSYTSCTRLVVVFSFVRSRKNPRDVSAAFGLFIAPAQFAFRLHYGKQRVCFIRVVDNARPVNVACTTAEIGGLLALARKKF